MTTTAYAHDDEAQASGSQLVIPGPEGRPIINIPSSGRAQVELTSANMGRVARQIQGQFEGLRRRSSVKDQTEKRTRNWPQQVE